MNPAIPVAVLLLFVALTICIELRLAEKHRREREESRRWRIYVPGAMLHSVQRDLRTNLMTADFKIELLPERLIDRTRPPYAIVIDTQALDKQAKQWFDVSVTTGLNETPYVQMTDTVEAMSRRLRMDEMVALQVGQPYSITVTGVS